MYGWCFPPGRMPTSSASSTRYVAAAECSASTTSSCCAGSRDAGHWTAAELLQLPEGEAAARLVSLRERGYLAARGRGRGTVYRLAPRHAGLVDAAVPTEDDVRVDEESVRLRLIALVIKEMNRDGEAVTVTNRRRPVAVLSTVPASEETHSAFVGMMVSVASGRL